MREIRKKYAVCNFFARVWVLNFAWNLIFVVLNAPKWAHHSASEAVNGPVGVSVHE